MENTVIDPLSEIAFKYGTDKCPQLMHPYTPFYYSLFKDRITSVKKVIEVGIGYWNGMKSTDSINYDRHLDRTYQKGASLKMWRDFFPNATIYGVDKMVETLFEDIRIHTFVLDERKESDIRKLINMVGSDIDLFVDDGSHRPEHQIFLCKVAMPLLQKNVVYVIEDVKLTALTEVVESLKEYNVERPVLQKRKAKPEKQESILLVVRNKQ